MLFTARLKGNAARGMTLCVSYTLHIGDVFQDSLEGGPGRLRGCSQHLSPAPAPLAPLIQAEFLYQKSNVTLM